MPTRVEIDVVATLPKAVTGAINANSSNCVVKGNLTIVEYSCLLSDRKKLARIYRSSSTSKPLLLKFPCRSDHCEYRYNGSNRIRNQILINRNDCQLDGNLESDGFHVLVSSREYVCWLSIRLPSRKTHRSHVLSGIGILKFGD